MPYETILEPINGLEAKKVLKSQMEQCIDKIPYLKVGNAFKQIQIGFELIFSAFPADVPVPRADWEIIIGLKEGEDAVFDEDKKKLEQLREKRGRVVANLKKIDEFLEKHNPSEAITVKESDNGTPDELRVAHGLKVPMLHTSPSGKKNEVLVNAGDLK